VIFLAPWHHLLLSAHILSKNLKNTMRETPYNFVVNHDDKIIVVTSQWAA
jgi:hypothetical protein